MLAVAGTLNQRSGRFLNILPKNQVSVAAVRVMAEKVLETVALEKVAEFVMVVQLPQHRVCGKVAPAETADESVVVGMVMR